MNHEEEKTKGDTYYPDPQAVAWAYRLFLGREPESQEIIDDKLSRNSTLEQLRREFLLSEEFKHKNSHILSNCSPALSGDEPAMSIEKIDDDVQLKALFSHIQQTWEHQGKVEPHYSVLSLEEYKKKNLKDTLQKFYDSGENDVKIIIKYLERNDIDINQFSTCLEYGCGLGRVTYWLAKKFDHVYAFDISKPHLNSASEYISKKKVENITFTHLSEVSDIHNLPKVDLIYTVIVLQHNPPPLISIIIRELVRSLNSGGVAIFQVPTYRMGYNFSLKHYLAENFNHNEMEMHVLKQEEVFKIVREEHAELVEVLEDRCAGNAYKSMSNTFLIRKL